MDGKDFVERRKTEGVGNKRMEDQLLSGLLDLTREMGKLTSTLGELKNSWDAANVPIRLHKLESTLALQAEMCSKVQMAKIEDKKSLDKERKEAKGRPINAIWIILTSVTSSVLSATITLIVSKSLNG